MSCLNETITVHCLQQICSDKSTECNGTVAAGVIVTGLIVAAVSVIIHLAMYIWFYKPRMEQGTNGAKKKSEENHDYETIYDEGKKTAVSTKSVAEGKEELTTQLSKNIAYFSRGKN